MGSFKRLSGWYRVALGLELVEASNAPLSYSHCYGYWGHVQGGHFQGGHLQGCHWVLYEPRFHLVATTIIALISCP